MQRAWNPHWIVQLNWKLLQLVSILGFSQSLEIVGCDFENILQTQKFAMTEPTKCETSHINDEQVNKGGLIYAKSSMSILKYCKYRAAYTVTVLKKSSWQDDATCLWKITNNSKVLPNKRVSQSKSMAGTQSAVTGSWWFWIQCSQRSPQRDERWPNRRWICSEDIKNFHERRRWERSEFCLPRGLDQSKRWKTDR